MRLYFYLAYVAPLSILGLLVLSISGQWPALEAALIAVAMGTTAALLARAFTLAAEIDDTRHKAIRPVVRIHVVLHAVPAAYLMTKLLAAPAAVFDFAWLAAFLLFFYTGRRVWIALFQLYRSKMYYFFYRGNTGLLFMLPILSASGLFFRSISEHDMIGRALSIYCAIHFLLIGTAVLKIASGVASRRTPDDLDIS